MPAFDKSGHEVTVDSAMALLEKAARADGQGYWDLSEMCMQPDFLMGLIPRLPDKAGGAWEGAVTLDLSSNRLGALSVEQLRELACALRCRPWLRVRLGYEVMPSVVVTALEAEEMGSAWGGQVCVDRPWENPTNKRLADSIASLADTTRGLITAQEGAVKHVKDSTAESDANNGISNAWEHQMAVGIKDLVGGEIVAVNYEWHGGDLDCLVAGVPVILIGEAKLNMPSKVNDALKQLASNATRWGDLCFKSQHDGEVDDEDGQLMVSPHDAKDIRKLRVREFAERNLVYALGGACIPKHTLERIEQHMRVMGQNKWLKFPAVSASPSTSSNPHVTTAATSSNPRTTSAATSQSGTPVGDEVPALEEKKSRKRTILLSANSAAKFPWATSNDGGKTVICTPCSAIKGEPVYLRPCSDTLAKHEAGQFVQKQSKRKTPGGDADDVVPSQPKAVSQHQKNVFLLEQRKLVATVVVPEVQTMDIRLALLKVNAEAFKRKLPQFITMLHELQHGRAVTGYEQSYSLFQSLPIVDQDQLTSSRWSDTSGWTIAEALDQVMLAVLRRRIAEADYISVSMDESTAIDHLQFMSVHLHVLGPFTWEREPFFLKVHKLAVLSCNAEILAAALIQVLETTAGLSKGQLARKLVNISCDGAAVLSGLRSGAIQRLRLHVSPFLQHVHDFSHRLSLVAHALDSNTLMKIVEELIRQVYAFFARSGARSQLLRNMQEFADESLLRMIRDVTTRWLSQLKPAERVWDQYHVLSGLFENLADTNAVEDLSEQVDQSTATSIYKHLVDVERLLSLALLLPLLRTLNALSQLTQQRHAFIQDLTDAVATTSAAIEDMYFGVDQFSPLHFIELAEVEYASAEAIGESQNEEPGRFSFVGDEDSNPILAITVKKDVRTVSFTTEEVRPSRGGRGRSLSQLCWASPEAFGKTQAAWYRGTAPSPLTGRHGAVAEPPSPRRSLWRETGRSGWMPLALWHALKAARPFFRTT
eukprot:gene8015-1245_t